ncbi:hypothetical protein GmHk_14G041403 [Glycine max]|nr:hypothetical protein GmHk_14G041403 [Glycine max]
MDGNLDSSVTIICSSATSTAASTPTTGATTCSSEVSSISATIRREGRSMSTSGEGRSMSSVPSARASTHGISNPAFASDMALESIIYICSFLQHIEGHSDSLADSDEQELVQQVQV